MSSEPFVSRAKVLPVKSKVKGYVDENEKHQTRDHQGCSERRSIFSGSHLR